MQRNQLNDGPRMNVYENKTTLLAPASLSPKMNNRLLAANALR